VFLVHYFDAFTDRPEELAFFQENLKDFLHLSVGVKWGRLKRTCDECLATVIDGIRHIRRQPGVDQERIGLVGFSLGGFVAMSAATEKELKIAAVVNLFGGLLEDLHPRVKALPVVLSVYGEKDQLVPVATARHLHKLLEDNSVADEMTVYPNTGHLFDDGKGDLRWAVAIDANRRATAFLEKHVKRGEPNKIASRQSSAP
jgi:dienelactone hydrolase